jgi:hypothetical protein
VTDQLALPADALAVPAARPAAVAAVDPGGLVLVEARQVTEASAGEVARWCGGWSWSSAIADPEVWLPCRAGPRAAAVLVREGQWVGRTSAGVFVRCAADDVPRRASARPGPADA